MLASDASTMEHALTEYMGKTISIRDSFAKSIRENFYHGLLIGILGSQGAWEGLRQIRNLVMALAIF